MDQQTETPQSRARRKLHVWADEYGMTRLERIEFSRYLLRRDVRSWKELDDEQVLRVLDAFEGHHLIETLFMQRPPSGPVDR